MYLIFPIVALYRIARSESYKRGTPRGLLFCRSLSLSLPLFRKFLPLYVCVYTIFFLFYFILFCCYLGQFTPVCVAYYIRIELEKRERVKDCIYHWYCKNGSCVMAIISSRSKSSNSERFRKRYIRAVQLLGVARGKGFIHLFNGANKINVM